MKPTLYILIFIYLTSCGNRDIERIVEENLPVIDLNNQDIESVDLNSIAKSIEYIPLKTSARDVIGWIYDINKTDQRIFVRDRQNNVYVFSESGELINKIKKVGKGTQKYSYISNFTVDEESQRMFIHDDGQNKVIIYDFEGNFIASRTLETKALNFTYLDPSTIIGYVPQKYQEGKAENSALAIVPVPEGDVTYLESEFEAKLPPKSPYVVNGILTRSYFQNVLFKDHFNDTVYLVQNDSTLLPRLVFDAGNRQLQPEDYANYATFREVENTKIQIWGLHFTRDYDCISFQEDGEKRVMIYHRESGRKMLSNGKGGIKNEKEGEEIYFFPRAISEDNELVGFYYQHELKNADLNPDGELHKIAAQMQYNASPVVAVVKLK